MAHLHHVSRLDLSRSKSRVTKLDSCLPRDLFLIGVCAVKPFIIARPPNFKH